MSLDSMIGVSLNKERYSKFCGSARMKRDCCICHCGDHFVTERFCGQSIALRFVHIVFFVLGVFLLIDRVVQFVRISHAQCSFKGWVSGLHPVWLTAS